MLTNKSIRSSVSRALLILVLTPILALGITLTWHNYSGQKKQAIEFLQEISKRAADAIYQPIQQLQSELVIAADIYDITHIPHREQFTALSHLLSNNVEMYRNIISTLTLVDRYGMELNKVSITEIFSSDDLVRHTAPEFTSPMQTGEVYYSPVWNDKSTGDPRIKMSIPLIYRRSGRIQAILIAELRLKELWRRATEIPLGINGSTYVIDGQGNVVAHRNPSIVLGGARFVTYKQAGLQKNMNGDIAFLAATEFNLGKQRLKVITELPFLEAFELTIRTGITIVAIIILAIFVSLGLGYFMIQRFVTPIESLADTASAINGGDLSRRTDVKRDDEVGVLAHAFNNMTSRLALTIDKQKESMSRIDYMVHYDTLTGLPNRHLLNDDLKQKLSDAVRHQTHGAVLFLDLDHFKTINDSLGHQIGDVLLCQVASRLGKKLTAEDTLARLGGDEFVIILGHISSNIEHAAQDARLVAEQLRQIVADPYELNGSYYRITTSIGVAMFPNPGETAADLIMHADTAMYRSKASGRNNIHFYQPEMQIAVNKRLDLEKDLLSAIKSESFTIHYQPIFNNYLKIDGIEGLIRWPSAQHGMIMPEHFIPIAEDSGLIVPIGDWILDTVCSQMRHWYNNENISFRHISVNISYRQFHEDDFVKKIVDILENSCISSNCLTLELTESVLMTNIDEAIKKITTLKSLGVRFSIDDFGTGHSSLNYLSQLPLDAIKIDKSFVHDLPYQKSSAAIVGAIIAMAKNLGLYTIAEGVQTQEQMDFLSWKGCDAYQGNYFSKPLPVKELVPFVRKHGTYVKAIENDHLDQDNQY